jgi:hypothetical protein
MANEWIQSDGAACYNSDTPGFVLSRADQLTVGDIYYISFTVSNTTAGKVILDSIDEKPEYTEDGDYEVVGIATSNNLSFIGEEFAGVFDGCIDDVKTRLIPFITIKDLSDNIIYEQTDDSIVTASGDNIQYNIDWSDYEEGCYKIYFTYASIDYGSDCLSIKLSHGCTILLSWTNDENAFGFDYSNLSFTQNLRVKAKLWMPNYPKRKNVFKDSTGSRSILKSETSKEELLTVAEMPEYLHDALSIGVEHDTLEVDGVEYINEESEYTPKWRKSSQLAPVEVVLIKDQNLKNSMC